MSTDIAIGRVGPARGVRGDVFVEPWTDVPDERFAVGSVIRTEPADAGPLTVAAMSFAGGKLVVRFAGVEVGTVDSMEFVGAEVEVVLKLNRDMQDKITTNSRASIGSLSLLGAPVIDLSAGPGGRPLRDWETVPSRRPYGQLADVADSATRGLNEATQLIQDLRQGKGTVGKLFSAALAGQSSVDDALKQAQDVATRTMTKGGYIK